MAVTLQDLKDYLNINFDNDDNKLERKLNAAILIVERYTNHSLVAKTISYTSNGYSKQIYQYPILSITGAESVCYDNLHVTINAKLGDIVTIQLGVSEESNLDEAVLRIAGDLYENVEISEVALPIDVQLLLNQFIRDSFID